MGCCLSKQDRYHGTIELSTPFMPRESGSYEAKSNMRCRYNSPPSPVLQGERAPWVDGHRVLTHKDGEIILAEPFGS
ncbi:hypothetical protein POSPLADRAFT_1037780, partial [Postia placenta MAD-698-R-SB12]